jgi:hypothetical protein
MNNTSYLQSGFVALLAVMSISLVLLVVTSNLTFVGWYTRFSVLEREQKAASVALAHSCLSGAVAHIAAEASYIGDATTTDVFGTCYIFALQPNVPVVGQLTVRVRAVVQQAVTSLVAVYAMHDMQLVAIPDVTPSDGTENILPSAQEWHEISD